MDVDADALEAPSDGDRIVLAPVVYENDIVDDLLVADFLVCLAKGFCRVIRGHHYDYFFISKHSWQSHLTRSAKGVQRLIQMALASRSYLI